MLDLIVFGGIILLVVGAYFALDWWVAVRATKRSLRSGADPGQSGVHATRVNPKNRFDPPNHGIGPGDSAW